VHLFRKKMPSLMNCWGTSRISFIWSDIVEARRWRFDALCQWKVPESRVAQIRQRLGRAPTTAGICGIATVREHGGSLFLIKYIHLHTKLALTESQTTIFCVSHSLAKFDIKTFSPRNRQKSNRPTTSASHALLIATLALSNSPKKPTSSVVTKMR
jgi:hypothetical protein